MKTYLMTSTAWQGEIELSYSDNLLLVNCNLARAELSEQQHIWFLQKLPRELSELQDLMKNTNSAKLTEIIQEITFAMFWNRYDEKIKSSKKKTVTIWNRLSKSNQAHAYQYIPKYFQSIPPGVNKKYAETYLNSEIWNN